MPPLEPVAGSDRMRRTLVPIDEHLNFNSGSLELDKEFKHIQSTRNHNASSLLQLLNQKSDKKNMQQSISVFGSNQQDAETQEETTNGQPTKLGWHITDLLQHSTSKPGLNNMAAALDYYKRSVKTEAELNMVKEIIIKNYRLRLVDALKDIQPEDRKLMTLNKGTCIHVANSLIKPEIYRYSTKVSNVTAELYLNEKPQAPSQNQLTSAPSGQQLDGLTYRGSSHIAVTADPE